MIMEEEEKSRTLSRMAETEDAGSEEDCNGILLRLRMALEGMQRDAAETFLEDLDKLVDGEILFSKQIRDLRDQLGQTELQKERVRIQAEQDQEILKDLQHENEALKKSLKLRESQLDMVKTRCDTLLQELQTTSILVQELHKGLTDTWQPSCEAEVTSPVNMSHNNTTISSECVTVSEGSEPAKPAELKAHIKILQNHLNDANRRLQALSRSDKKRLMRENEELRREINRCKHREDVAQRSKHQVIRKFQEYLVEKKDYFDLANDSSESDALMTIDEIIENFIAQFGSLRASFTDVKYSSALEQILCWCEADWCWEKMRCMTANILCVLARKEVNKVHLLRLNCIPRIMKYIKSESGTAQTCEYVAAFLSNMALKCNAARDAIVEREGVEYLIRLVRNNENDGIKAKACSALANIACGKDSKDVIVERNGISALLDICKNESSSPELLENAVRAIRNLAHGSELNSIKISSLGGLDVLHKLSCLILRGRRRSVDTLICRLSERAGEESVTSQVSAAISNVSACALNQNEQAKRDSPIRKSLPSSSSRSRREQTWGPADQLDHKRAAKYHKEAEAEPTRSRLNDVYKQHERKEGQTTKRDKGQESQSRPAENAGKDSEQKPTESRRSKSYVSIYNHRKIEERAEDRGSPSLPS